MLLIVEPLDEPDGLLLGHRIGGKRFATLFNYTPQVEARSAIENVDGRNVGNETTFTGNVFRKDRMSQVLVTVTNRRCLSDRRRADDPRLAGNARPAVAFGLLADAKSRNTLPRGLRLPVSLSPNLLGADHRSRPTAYPGFCRRNISQKITVRFLFAPPLIPSPR